MGLYVYSPYVPSWHGQGELYFWCVTSQEPEGKRPLGRPRRRWEDNIKMDLQEMGCGGYGLDGTGLGKGQVAAICECGNGPSGSVKCREFFD